MWSSAGGSDHRRRARTLTVAVRLRIDAMRPVCVGASRRFAGRLPSERTGRRTRKTSVRSSASLPWSCSGAMDSSVPKIVPSSRRRARINEDPSSSPSPPARPRYGAPGRVEQLGAGRNQHDVARFEIAMDDVRAVCVGERVSDLDCQPEDLGAGSAPRVKRSSSVSPSRYSMTMNGWPLSSPTS